jgi:hypothetical protein
MRDARQQAPHLHAFEWAHQRLRHEPVKHREDSIGHSRSCPGHTFIVIVSRGRAELIVTAV